MPKIDITRLREEAQTIVTAIHQKIPKFLDGRAVTNLLREQGEVDGENYGWKEMEWPGWFFEFFCNTEMVRNAGGFKAGRSFPGTNSDVQFDIENKFVWDLKCHANDAAMNFPLNDKKAMDACFDTLGGIGFIILCGDAIKDTDGSFKAWHDEEKRKAQGGKDSAYMLSGTAKNPSRKRKVSFRPTHIKAIFLHETPLSEGKADRTKKPNGMLSIFRQGQNPGRATAPVKYLLRGKKVPKSMWLVDQDVTNETTDFFDSFLVK